VDPLDEEYARPVYKNKERWTQLHWYYFPDSHDSWVNAELPVDPPEVLYGSQHPTPWRVIIINNIQLPTLVLHSKLNEKLRFCFVNVCF